RAYDAERGRVDWEAVAAGLGAPLVDCLAAFDAAALAVVPRSRPGLVDWSKDDVRALKGFVSDNFEALAGHGWEVVGVYMNIRPDDCRKAYFCDKSGRMTAGMHRVICKYLERGMSWREIHETFPIYSDQTVIYNAFRAYKPKQPEAAPAVVGEYTGRYSKTSAKAESASCGTSAAAARSWDATETDRLHRAVGSYDGGLIDWDAVGAALNRTAASCKSKYIAECRNLLARPRMGHEAAVNQEVQRQYESGVGVDWAAAAQATGLSELECLELCRFSEGKARWTWGPDVFSQRTVGRMEAFIAEHYPRPAVTNFYAVSNYLWIDINDCIQVSQLLRGKFEWTDEVRARVGKMLRQGMDFDEIAQELSPVLTGESIRRRYHRIGPEEKDRPFTPEEKRRIRDIVSKNAGKIPLAEIQGLVKRAFPEPWITGRACAFASTYATSNPLYKARAEGVDVARIASAIQSGETTAAEKGRQLDVPASLVTRMVSAHHRTAAYVHGWSEHENRQLLEALSAHSPPYNWSTISALVGTKSSRQCCQKFVYLQKSGQLPPPQS
ncbi:hypothetical protein H4R18_005037, partial [Coemansia javaensis]